LLNYKVNVQAPNNVIALNLSNQTGAYGYISRAEVKNSTTKAWVVNYNFLDNFFVYGDGAYRYKSGFQWSDASLKENIYTITDAINKISQLRGVYFNYKAIAKNDTTILDSNFVQDTKTYMGLIAQEVESIVPEVVSTDENGLKGIAYENLVGLLIEGIKLQQIQLNNMQNQITSQMLQINDQSNLINGLAQTVNETTSSLNEQISLLQQQIYSCCGIQEGMMATTRDSSQHKSKSIMTNNTTGSFKKEDSNIGTTSARLYQNSPNPFYEKANIEFDIPSGNITASIYIYNFQGQQLKSFTNLQSGHGIINIKASDFAAGIYFYTLIVNGKEVDTKKMILTQ